MPAAVDTSKSDVLSKEVGNTPGGEQRAFLVRNDIKLFQRESHLNNNSSNKNNNNNSDSNKYMLVDRRRSDTDALNYGSDVKLVRQKLLKYAHVQSQDSADGESGGADESEKNYRNRTTSFDAPSIHSTNIGISKLKLDEKK